MRDGIDDESYGQIFKPVSTALSRVSCKLAESSCVLFLLCVDNLKSDGDVPAERGGAAVWR